MVIRDQCKISVRVRVRVQGRSEDGPCPHFELCPPPTKSLFPNKSSQVLDNFLFLIAENNFSQFNFAFSSEIWFYKYQIQKF